MCTVAWFRCKRKGKTRLKNTQDANKYNFTSFISRKYIIQTPFKLHYFNGCYRVHLIQFDNPQKKHTSKYYIVEYKGYIYGDLIFSVDITKVMLTSGMGSKFTCFSCCCSCSITNDLAQILLINAE